MAKLNDLIVTIGATTRDFDKGLGKAMRKMRTFGKNTKALGKSLTRNLTAPIAAMGGFAVKAAADFEFAMAKVKAVSGFTAEEVGRLEEQAKQLGASTSKSASEVAALQLELAKLGKSSTEIESMTESVLSLGIAFDQDLGEVAETVGSTLNQFGLNASESGRVADVMATAFGSSSLDLERFRESMKVAGPVANEFGFSLEETTAVLGTLANSAISGSDAGTKFKMALSELAAEGDDVKDTFVQLLKGNISYTEAMDVFGKRAAILGPILGKNGEKLAELQTKLMNSSGAANNARKVLEDTAMGGFAALQSAAEAASITLGQALMPTVNKVAKFITDLASGIANMNSETRESVIKFVAIAAAIGPLLVILPSIISGFTMLLSPVGLVIGAIVGLGIAIVTFADEIAPYITDVINYFITLYNESAAVRTIIGLIKGTVVTVFDFFGFAIDSIIASFRDLGAIIVAVVDGDFSAIPDLVGKAFENGAERMAQFGRKAAENYTEAVNEEVAREPLELVTEESINQALSTLGGLANLIPTIGGGGGGAGAATGAGAGAGGMQPLQPRGVSSGVPEPQLIQKSSTAVSDMADSQSDLNNEIGISISMASQMEAAYVGIGMALGGLITGTMTMADVFGQAIAGLANLLIDLGAQFIAAGVAATAFYANLIANPPAAIAAGVGLVAAGAVIKGLQARMESKPPALAQGGLAFGPTLAMVGDNQGAGVDPEVIAPLSKLQDMMGGQQVQVTGRISGRDILLTSERNAIDRNRVRGY
jgi:hypothetical protein